MTERLKEMQWFRVRLTRWFRDHGRAFPWRESDEPFQLLLAEIMLRRVWPSAVEPVFREMVRQYPTVEALAEADLADVERILAPAGLRWRARDMLKTAQILRDLFGGRTPETREALMQLPGVGSHVAGMVASAAFNKREWILDTSVARVFQRFFGVSVEGDPRRSNTMLTLAREYADAPAPGRANLALVDHAALICRPAIPLCPACPVRERCRYYLLHEEDRRADTAG